MKRSIGADTIVFTAPVFVVGTYDKDGRPNIMTAAWGGICCSDPPCIAVSLRKATYSYGNIMHRMAYTINVPSEEHLAHADFAGTRSGRDVDKFEANGLTPVRSDLVDAPYVGEFPMVLECRVVGVSEIGLHTQFVGRILDVKVEEACMGEGGIADIKRVRPFVFDMQTGAYYGIGEPLGQGPEER